MTERMKKFFNWGSPSTGNSNPSKKSSKKYSAKGPSKGVLILGETGCGKSTFINTITNYFKKGSLDNLRIAIPTQYFQGTEGYNNSECDLKNTSVSQTDDCITYSFDSDGMIYNFIDTPGLNDSRGGDQDEKNLDKILTAAHDAKDLAAILLVINGTQTRVTPALRNVFVSLRGNLPDSVTDNIIVVLTKCRADTTAFKLSNIADIAPNLRKESIFFMDNTAFVSRPKNGRLIQSDTLVAEWNTSMKACAKIATRVRGFTQVATEDFATMRTNRFELKRILNNVKVEMVNLQGLLEQLDVAEKKQKQLATDKESFKNFTKTNITKQKKPKPTPYHNTLCSTCDHVCHERCGLSEISEQGANAFIGCYAMSGTNNCRQCPGECSFTVHYHARQVFELVEESVEEVLQDMKDKFEQATQQSDAVNMKITDLASAKVAIDQAMKQKVADLRGVCDAMKKICSGFNFADELRMTLIQLKTELKSLRSVDAQDSAMKVIQAFEHIINQYSKIDRSNPRTGKSRADLDDRELYRDSDDEEDAAPRGYGKSDVGKRRAFNAKTGTSKYGGKNRGYGDSEEEEEEESSGEEYIRSPKGNRGGKKGKTGRSRRDEDEDSTTPSQMAQLMEMFMALSMKNGMVMPSHRDNDSHEVVRRPQGNLNRDTELENYGNNNRRRGYELEYRSQDNGKRDNSLGYHGQQRGGAVTVHRGGKGYHNNDERVGHHGNPAITHRETRVTAPAVTTTSVVSYVKNNTCIDCQAPWELTADEYTFYVGQKNGVPPKRCKVCRKKRADNAKKSEFDQPD